jgi:hypothetical protein
MSRKPPMYARLLRLRNIHPGGLLCFLFFEGALGFGVLLALAELVTPWTVLILPGMVAVMVKVNDVVAGIHARSMAARGGLKAEGRVPLVARGRARVASALRSRVVASAAVDGGTPLAAADTVPTARRPRTTAPPANASGVLTMLRDRRSSPRKGIGANQRRWSRPV